MRKETPVVFINGLIGCLDHSSLHQSLYPLPVLVPDLLGYGHLRGAGDNPENSNKTIALALASKNLSHEVNFFVC